MEWPYQLLIYRVVCVVAGCVAVSDTAR